jgi:hypothetical protein
MAGRIAGMGASGCEPKRVVSPYFLPIPEELKLILEACVAAEGPSKTAPTSFGKDRPLGERWSGSPKEHSRPLFK